jgi:hypothetical protein
MFCVAGFAALAFAGDDAKTYDVELKARWEAGQTVTVTVHETYDKTSSEGGNLPRTERELLDATYVVRCDAADANGEPTRSAVFLKSWKKTEDATTDESISGALVVVEGKEWKLADGRTPGIQAKRWLDREFIKGRKAPLSNPLSRLVLPKMSVGQTWKPDGKTVIELFDMGGTRSPFDASTVTMEVTLASVDGTPPRASGRFDIKVRMPITTFPGMPQDGAVGSGSGFEITGDRTGPLTTSTMHGIEHMQMEYSVVVNVPQDVSRSVTMKVHMTESKSTVAGGEIPAATPEAPKPATPASGGK